MFETLSFIGRGGYGNVYKCRNTKTGHEYAVKSIGMIEYGIRNLNESNSRCIDIQYRREEYYHDDKYRNKDKCEYCD